MSMKLIVVNKFSLYKPKKVSYLKKLQSNHNLSSVTVTVTMTKMSRILTKQFLDTLISVSNHLQKDHPGFKPKQHYYQPQNSTGLYRVRISSTLKRLAESHSENCCNLLGTVSVLYYEINLKL